MTCTFIFLIFSYVLIHCFCASAVNGEEGKLWIVGVAGFDFYIYTYGMEAGLYKSCQLFSGFDNERIITISPNTAAYHPKNPKPGTLMHGLDPYNSYKNVNVTYNSRDMTPELFYEILRGNEAAVKGIGYEKVLKSGPQDTVVLMIVTVGLYGMIALTNDHFLTAEEFIPVLEDLNKCQKFKKMIILVDSPYAASMFDYLDPDSNIIVFTSAAREDGTELFYFNSQVSAYGSTVFALGIANELEGLVLWKKYENTTLFDYFQGFRRRASSDIAVPGMFGQFDLGNTKLTEIFGPPEKMEKAVEERRSEWVW